MFNSNDKHFGRKFEARTSKSFEIFQIFHTFKMHAKEIGFNGKKNIKALYVQEDTTLALPLYTLISKGDDLRAIL